MSVREVARLTGMDPWFLHQMKHDCGRAAEGGVRGDRWDRGSMICRRRSAWGSRDERLAAALGREGREGAAQVRALRERLGVKPVFKLVDTCAAEFESFTPYLYSLLRRRG